MRGAWPPPAIWENRVGEGKLAERDLTAAEERGREWPQRGLDSSGLAELQYRIHPRRHPDANRCAILRFDERLARGDWPFVTIILGLRPPLAEDAGRPANHDGAIIE